MISNGPSRTFTREAVEAWLHRLSLCDWEKSIDRNLLNKAQAYYRKGLLSALDIQSEQVIITQKVNREETYSVVEWKNGKPEIRTSLDDENLGFVLGTAGLYEIEELIAEIQDEDPLFGQLEFDNEILQSNSEIIEENNQNNDDEVIEAPTLELIVSLDISLKKGLLATPKWKLSEKEETKVYGSVSISTDQETDRPALMRFVAEANDKGFSFDKENGTFLLSDWNRIAHLSDEFLPMWEKSFNLRLEGEAKLLKHGQRTLNWEIEARSRSEESMALRERFQLGSHKLGRESIRKISRAKLGATFIRGHGLVKLDQKQIDDFDWWQRNRGISSVRTGPNTCSFHFSLESISKQDPMENSLTGRIQFENWRRMGSPKGFPFYARTKNKALHKFMLFINLVVMLFLQMKWVSGRPSSLWLCCRKSL